MAYSMKTKELIQDVDRVGRARGDTKTMKANEDGSGDIYFVREPPPGQERDWTPTGEDFLAFRLSGPAAPVVDKSWTLGNVENVPS